ncbi:MAG TPA: NlpC/P60 family protein [bacterium]|nr:NlpC/P60 family protein [bacterium]HOL47865.1 NlpC/P60 family protein [bacterium]HPQ17904.1 NlpC/P60 family protein [bacterium]
MKILCIILIFLIQVKLVKAKEIYTIQLGAFKIKENAEKFSKKLLEENLPVYIESNNEFDFIFCGRYETKEEAKSELQKVKELFGIKGIIKIIKEEEKENVIFNPISETKIISKEEVKNEIPKKVKKTKLEKKILKMSKKFLKVKYNYGGESKRGIDCSGLVYVVFNKLGINLPRRAEEQVNYGEEIIDENYRIGDLIFFKNKEDDRINHVGIYIGDNKMVHASSKKRRVIISDINEDYYKENFYIAKRIINGNKILITENGKLEEKKIDN